MFNIGMPELIVILLITLVVFGPRRLPRIGRMIARIINELKRGIQDLEDAIKQESLEETGEDHLYGKVNNESKE